MTVKKGKFNDSAEDEDCFDDGNNDENDDGNDNIDTDDNGHDVLSQKSSTCGRHTGLGLGLGLKSPKNLVFTSSPALPEEDVESTAAAAEEDRDFFSLPKLTWPGASCRQRAITNKILQDFMVGQPGGSGSPS